MRGLWLLLVLLGLAADLQAAPRSVVTVAEDATARAITPDSPEGGASVLRSGSASRAFLAFRLPPLEDGAILSATLVGSIRPPVPASPVPLHDVSFVADDAWTEATLTWNAQPVAAATPTSQLDVVALGAGSEFAVDVTAPAQAEQAGDGRLSLRLAPAAGASGGEVLFGAWEGNAPFRLELELSLEQRAHAGDLLAIESTAPTGRVVASDPARFAVRELASLLLPRWIWSAARDPASGAVYAIDRGLDDGRLLRFAYPGARPEVVSEGGALDRYSQVTLSATGEIYASGFAGAPIQAGAIVRVDPVTGAQTVVWSDPLPVGFTAIGALAAAADGTLLVGRYAAGIVSDDRSVVRVDPVTGNHTTLISTSAIPLALAPAPDGTIWALMFEFDTRIVRIDPVSGVVTEVATTPEWAEGIVVEPGGSLLITSVRDLAAVEPGGGYIDRFDPVAGSFIRLYSDPSSSPGGLLREQDGSWLALWSDREGVRISRHDGSSFAESVLAAPLGPVPLRLAAVDARGQLLAISGYYQRRLVRIDAATGAQQLLHHVPGDSTATISDATVSPTGRIFVVVGDGPGQGSRLLEIDARTDMQREVVRCTDACGALAFAPDGRLFTAVTTMGAPKVGSVLQVDPESGSVVTISTGDLLVWPASLAFDPVTGDLLVAERLGDKLLRIDADTGAQEIVAATSGATSASSVVADGLGGAYLLGWSSAVAVELATGETTPLRVGGMALRRARCSDGFDNDRDDATDWPADADCPDPRSEGEKPTGCGIGAELAVILGWMLNRRRVRSVPTA